MIFNTEGNKTKVMAMTEGDSDITTNDRRFTIEKRGNPAGAVAWRVRTSNDQIDTVRAPSGWSGTSTRRTRTSGRPCGAATVST